MTPVKTYVFCDHPNFGDMLNFDILKLFNRCAESCPLDKCALAAIGSILQLFTDYRRKVFMRFLTRHHCRRLPPLHVWGSGFVMEHRKPRIFSRRVKIHALRGVLTKNICETILGRHLDVVLGDPGLLANFLINEGEVQKEYDIGVAIALGDKSNPLVERLDFKRGSFLILDPAENPLVFLKKLVSCRRVVSSMLHGLIVADAFGIPNRWISFCSPGIPDALFKFHDYYSSLGIHQIAPWYMCERGVGDEHLGFVKQ